MKVVIYFVKRFTLHAVRHNEGLASAPSRVDYMLAIRTEAGVAYVLVRLTVLVVHHNILFVAGVPGYISHPPPIRAEAVGVFLYDGTRFHLHAVDDNHLTLGSIS